MSVAVITAGGIGDLVSSFLTATTGGSFALYSSTSGHLHLPGADFVKMVKETSYKHQLDIPSKIYEVYIQRARLHRLLLVKEKGSTLPLITFEIIAPDLWNFKPLMRKFSQDRHGMEKVGDYNETLFRLCEIADKVVHKMGNYRLLTNNCQHFCNNLLQEMGFEILQFETTFGPNVSISKPNGEKDTADFMPCIVDSACRSALLCTPSIVGKAAGVAMGCAIGAPIPTTIVRK